MTQKKPKISLLIWTYNRAHLVERAIQSVLKQTYQDFELVLVNNGSQDNTRQVLEKYQGHEKIRIFHLEKNRGDLGGMNFSLDQIGGEWFATLGDDDEILENTFELLMKLPTEIDPEINAVTCNSINTSTGKFSGFGLDRDQYLPVEVIVGKVRGEFFGITKTELLGNKRIREDLPGEENVFWHQIDAIAKRYYIHKGLKIWHTDHGGTESARIGAADIGLKTNIYRLLLEEQFYWNLLRKYNIRQYAARCLRGLVFLSIAREKEGAEAYKQLLKQVDVNLKIRLLSKITVSLPPRILHAFYLFFGNNRLFYNFLFRKYSRISR